MTSFQPGFGSEDRCEKLGGIILGRLARWNNAHVQQLVGVLAQKRQLAHLHRASYCTTRLVRFLYRMR